MTTNFTLNPVNPDHYKKLLKFGEVIFNICNKVNVSPVIYGSLACFYHTKNENMKVNDLDLLVPENSFPDFINQLKNHKELTYEKMQYPSIVVHSDDLKIDLDSIEKYLFPRSASTESTKIDGISYNILNPDSLIDIYQEAVDRMPRTKEFDKQRELYLNKIDSLKNA